MSAPHTRASPVGRDSTRRWAALASLTAYGVFAQITQVLLLREFLVVLDGDELALAVMLSAWLFWVGLGAAVARTGDGPAGPTQWLARAAALAGLSLPAAILVLRLARPLFNVPSGAPLPLGDAALLALGASAVPGFCIGVMFPALVPAAGVRPAIAYGCEAAGAMAGGLLFTFVLVSRWSPVATAASAGALAVLCVAWLIRRSSQPGPRAARMLTLPAGLLLAVALLGAPIDRWSEALRWRSALAGFELVETQESPYGRYALLRAGGQFSLFLDGQVVCDLPDPHAAGVVVHTALLQHPAPRSVLLIARDPLAALRESRRHRLSRIDCVAMDPRPIELLRRHIPAACWIDIDAPEVRLLQVDPIAHLDATPPCYDVILVDMPDPATLGLNRLFCREFLQRAADRLNPGGVLALAVSGQENDLGPLWLARNAIVYHTVRSVLPAVLASPGDICLILAQKSLPDGRASNRAPKLSLDVDALAARLSERGLDLPAYRAFLYSDAFPAERVARVNQELAAWTDAAREESPFAASPRAAGSAAAQTSVAGAPTNGYFHPCAHWATRVLGVSLRAPRWLAEVRSLPRAAGACLWTLAALGIGLALVTRSLDAVARVRHGRLRPCLSSETRGAIGPERASAMSGLSRGRHATSRAASVALAVATAAMGFAVMAEQMVVLLWYQCRAGQVYVGLAALTAMFMAGLALGSLLTTRLRRPRCVLLAMQAAMIAIGLVLALDATYQGLTGALPERSDVPYAVAALVSCVLAGVLGAHFSCCAALWPAPATRQSGPAGWLYAADLAGAMLASLFVTAVIIPSQGHASAAAWGAVYACVALLVTVAATTGVPGPGGRRGRPRVVTLRSQQPGMAADD